MTDNRINFVNAGVIAEERGISISHAINTEITSFSNLLVASVITDTEIITVSGSVFANQFPRIVEIMGYEVDVNPIGNMLFLKNKDVPGVIGKVGLLLGESNINIAEYLLSRIESKDTAYSIIKIDGQIDNEQIKKLSSIDEILDVKQLYV